MTYRLLLVAFWLAFASSSLLASTQDFNLTWSGNTNFIGTYLGSGSVSGARATGHLTLDLDALSSPPPTGTGSYSLPHPAFVDFTMTVSGAGSGNGTFLYGDFGSAIFDTLGTSLDFSQELIGQVLTSVTLPADGNHPNPWNPQFGNLTASTFPAPPVGNLAFSSGTGGSAPTTSSIAFIMITAGGSGNYLQLVNVTPVPEPSTALTVIMALSLCGVGLAVRLARRKATPR